MDSLVVEGLSKCYYLGKPDSPARRTLGQFLRAPLGDEAGGRREFWALKNVSFRVQPGTILGIVGANGAGKSTLLKVLARVITPTSGRATGVGRVVSLLELGAGFDPDLPARENILMNAAMLGISRHEALRRMDGILAFAEVEQFVDSPLRFYSSGMYLRLAFSVAINMNPQMLLADEILAVGDQAFQERCLRRVEEEGREGLTVLFVSHDMDAVLKVCNRVMWINGGEIVKLGDPEEVVDEYQNATWAHVDATRSERGRRSNNQAEVLSVRLALDEDREVGGAPISEDVYVKIRFLTKKKHLSVRASLDLSTKGTLIFRTTDELRLLRKAGVYEVLAKIPKHLLAEQTYSVSVSLLVKRHDEEKEQSLIVYNALSFLAFATEEPGAGGTSGKLERVGCLAPRLEWTMRKEELAADA